MNANPTNYTSPQGGSAPEDLDNKTTHLERVLRKITLEGHILETIIDLIWIGRSCSTNKTHTLHELNHTTPGKKNHNEHHGHPHEERRRLTIWDSKPQPSNKTTAVCSEPIILLCPYDGAITYQSRDPCR